MRPNPSRACDYYRPSCPVDLPVSGLRRLRTGLFRARKFVFRGAGYSRPDSLHELRGGRVTNVEARRAETVPERSS